MTMGERARSRRHALGLSQVDVARTAGVSLSYIWSVENDRGRGQTDRTLGCIAQALGVDIAYLVDGREPEVAAVDREFIARYLALADKTRETIRKIVAILTDGGNP